jgi:sugar lactone lactonase YvrE
VRTLRYALVLLVALALLAAFGVRARYGGGAEFPDRTGEPSLAGTALEKIADLPHPPGNVAVASSGRVFATFHPDASPPTALFELVDGKPVPFPSRGLPGGLEWQSPLALRVDAKNRLWVLDHGRYGLGQARLVAFDLATGALVHRHDFPAKIAIPGSMLNDFEVSPDGQRVYVADASPWALVPSVVVYDVEASRSVRLLEGHESVLAEEFAPVVQGRRMEFLGLFTVRPGVDSIALDAAGEWLYFAPVTNRHLYRVRTADLDALALDWRALATKVERWGEKTMSDGIAMDAAGTVYLTDLEHSAIVALDPDGKLRTLVRDERLRWPDGLAFGPDGFLYVTCSALHQVLFNGSDAVAAHAPYQIFRFRPPPRGLDG